MDVILINQDRATNEKGSKDRHF